MTLKLKAIKPSTKIYIAGHKGMVGASVWRTLEAKGYIKSINTKIYDNVFSSTVQKPQFLAVGQEVLSIDPKYFRPTEVDLLIGDASKAKEKLGWECDYDLQDLVKDMMQSDVKLMQKAQLLKDNGYETLNYFE